MPFKLDSQKYYRKYLECKKCGHWFSFHNLNLENLYEEEYVNSTYGGFDGMKNKFEKIISLPLGKSDNLERVERINHFLGKKNNKNFRGKLLDIGCGLGVFPYEMQKLGWEVTGSEKDDRTIKHLNREVGLKNIYKNFDEIKRFSFSNYDLITLNKVLEHVVDPINLLKEVSLFIKETGYIYIEVPDTENASRNGDPLQREEFYIEHHHGFTLTSLSQALDISGLKIESSERIFEPSGKYTLFCFCSKSKPFFKE